MAYCYIFIIVSIISFTVPNSSLVVKLWIIFSFPSRLDMLSFSRFPKKTAPNCLTI